MYGVDGPCMERMVHVQTRNSPYIENMVYVLREWSIFRGFPGVEGIFHVLR